MNHIELFAGCGGLALGMESVGFELLLANELSPMAAETFAYNLLHEDLQQTSLLPSHVQWLSSNYPREQMHLRLRENPQTYQSGKFCDISSDGGNLAHSLIVGSIVNLNQWLRAHPKAKLALLDNKEVDLVSGGPPCQSFSLAGLREKNNEKNSLPWEFAKFVDIVKPKMVLLENVSGILRPFIESGEKYYAWFEVAKAFAKIGYIPLTLHINAKYVGVAQNRPRFILLGFRKDIFEKLWTYSFNSAELMLLESSRRFFKLVSGKRKVTLNDLLVHDLNKPETFLRNNVQSTFLSPLFQVQTNFVSVKDAIDDLSAAGTRPSQFVRQLNQLFAPYLKKQNDINAHRIIDSDIRVKKRFMLYQVLSKINERSVQREVMRILNGLTQSISDEAWEKLKSYNFLSDQGTKCDFITKEAFTTYLLSLQTKKQMQKALLANEPAPAALSIPDDACHYSELRTLSAREMARIQSFPDSFVFRSKMTTGGLNRRFEVPIYTQIGNAVPVLLGRSLGLCVRNLLKRLE